MYKSVILSSVEEAKQFNVEFKKLTDHKTIRLHNVVNIKMKTVDDLLGLNPLIEQAKHSL